MTMKQEMRNSISFRHEQVSPDKLQGNVIHKIVRSENELLFLTDGGLMFILEHRSDCCESVELIDICGDLEDLLFSPILGCEIVTNNTDPVLNSAGYLPESFTWTFVKIWTAFGSVTLRWYGTSNGYYSEVANLYELHPKINRFGWDGIINTSRKFRKTLSRRIVTTKGYDE